jgi:hypothetical protein
VPVSPICHHVKPFGWVRCSTSRPIASSRHDPKFEQAFFSFMLGSRKASVVLTMFGLAKLRS